MVVNNDRYGDIYFRNDDLIDQINTRATTCSAVDSSFEELRNRVRKLEELLEIIGGHCFFEPEDSSGFKVNSDDSETSISFEDLHGFLDDFSMKQE